ncbi:MAG: imidazolonepropionase [Cyclobacteriaceae bacterium]
MTKLIGPFRQLLSMDQLPLRGPIKDDQLAILNEAGILVNGDQIAMLDDFEALRAAHPTAEVDKMEDNLVVLPGFIDSHTHICFAGSRAGDYAMRNAGKSYQEIAATGGGIWDTVTQTRSASLEELISSLSVRASRHLLEGVTTCEVKSGYGLDVANELKMLQAICKVDTQHHIDLISTCLAAHIKPKDFEGNNKDYLNMLLAELLPQVKGDDLASRVDIFIEENAFSKEEGLNYLQTAKEKGFDVTVHADQFTPGGSSTALQVEALSADHLEASTELEINALGKSQVFATALPGASLGLGEPFAPARKLLDAGCGLAIASDWNPGSAPMGDLLLQAAVLGSAEKLSAAEVFAGLTYRAAAALRLDDRGQLKPKVLADFIAFPTDDYREILYHQGKLKPNFVFKRGRRI